MLSKITKEELEIIVSSSKSYSEVLRKIGYNSESGYLINQLKEKIKEYNLSTEHFIAHIGRPTTRTEEDIFIENSTASQATLRRWYKKGQYTEHKCSICGLEPFWNGKELTLILDHINGHNHDDRLENLRWVCPNCNQQLDTTGARNYSELKPKNTCIDCGKTISDGSVRCLACNGKTKYLTIKPSREELKQLIRTETFTALGKKYGVCDTTISKWCKKDNLPYRKKDIIMYSDEEWENI